MSHTLNKDFTALQLLEFTLPSVLMMMFISIYSMVDGFFVSNYVNENAFSSLNIVWPYSSLLIAIGTMFAMGGSAVVSKKLGEGKTDDAYKSFTLITIFSVAISIVIGILGITFTRQIASFLGATDILMNDCYTYLYIIAWFTPFSIIHLLAEIFFVVSGRAHLGFFVILAGGIANILFDYILIVLFNMGIAGAALGTGLGYCIPSFVYLIYFLNKKHNRLHFVIPEWNMKTIWNTCTNGSSEMVINISTTITTVLFNRIIIQFAGESGVAAVGIIMYAQFFIISAFIGYSQGVSPIIAYAYGAKNNKRLHHILKTSLIIIGISSLISFISSILLKGNIISLFVDKDSSTFFIAKSGFTIFTFSFLFTGLNVFASAFFTALSNGKISAFISFARTLFFVVLFLLILPKIFELQGVWLAIPFAEICSVFISIYFILKYRKKYNY